METVRFYEPHMITSPEWRELLVSEWDKYYFRKLMGILKDKLQTEDSRLLPARKHVFRPLNDVDYSDVRVVILGQDPYPNDKKAIGRAFAVPDGEKAASLNNIMKEVGVQDYNGELDGWVSQGVMLLNSVLTVSEFHPGSHRNIGWEQFTDRIISLLNERIDRVLFMLWGNDARKKEHLITNDRHIVIKTGHPSPLAMNAGFIGSKIFEKANKHLDPPINWSKT